VKIQYWSDIHLEFPENAKYIMERRIDVTGEILVLAGDIAYWDERHFNHPFFDKISRKFEKVFWVPGNHEFYNGFDLSVIDNPVKIEIRDNVFLVNNWVESIGDTDLFFTTLWSKIKARNAFYIEQKVNDFHLINYKDETLTAQDFNQLCSVACSFLETSLRESIAKNRVVVTHHCPTQLSNPAEYQRSQINEAFVVELDEFIANNHIDYWIFGHTHGNEPEVNINGTRIVTNQLGYISFKENKGFKIDAHITV
jgi:predicted phosphodiesterase